MNPFRAGVLLNVALWLLLVMIPAGWSLVESGGLDRMIQCLGILWREGLDAPGLAAIPAAAGRERDICEQIHIHP